jgi:hypothetical protein
MLSWVAAHPLGAECRSLGGINRNDEKVDTHGIGVARRDDWF